MAARTGWTRSRTPALAAWLGMAVLLGSAACSDADPVSPLVVPQAPGDPAVLAAAWTFDVLGTRGEIRVTPPARGLSSAVAMQRLADYFGLPPAHPELSLLGDDVVEVRADNSTLVFSPVGQYLPGHVRVSFDVVVRNRLSGVHLITPTFPEPPAGVRGVLLFPFETMVLESAPRTTGGGGVVVVELPSAGRVAPSPDWDGAPHNFFNDVGCPQGATNCYRYEVFGDPLPAGATSAASRVGFDVEATVSQFRFRAILAADLVNAG